MDEKEKNPTWKAGDMEANKPTKMKLDCAKSIASGTNKYGEWNMWVGIVENQKVTDIDRTTILPNYSGKVILFPNDYLNKEFLKATGSAKVGTEVDITLIPKKGTKGFYSTYQVKVLVEGVVPSNQVPYNHSQYLNDFKKLTDKKLVDSNKEDFISLGTQAPYNIDANDLESLWSTFNAKDENN